MSHSTILSWIILSDQKKASFFVDYVPIFVPLSFISSLTATSSTHWCAAWAQGRPTKKWICMVTYPSPLFPLRFIKWSVHQRYKLFAFPQEGSKFDLLCCLTSVKVFPSILFCLNVVEYDCIVFGYQVLRWTKFWCWWWWYLGLIFLDWSPHHQEYCWEQPLFWLLFPLFLLSALIRPKAILCKVLED